MFINKWKIPSTKLFSKLENRDSSVNIMLDTKRISYKVMLPRIKAACKSCLCTLITNLDKSQLLYICIKTSTILLKDFSSKMKKIQKHMQSVTFIFICVAQTCTPTNVRHSTKMMGKRSVIVILICSSVTLGI